LVIYSNASVVAIVYPITCKCLAPVIYSAGAPGDFVVASGSSLVLPRAAVLTAADTGGQHSMLRYTGSSTARCAMEGGAAEGGAGAGEEERRRDEGTGDGAKEVARAAGGKATGAWVIGG
jgi:hypothetical protein